ncbi:helix-turn-helix domain-containing protein [Streptosporangium fragile]|uniref:Helix-turn-helix domain-containing protein n=1 Tax=Streptosporangium fragile TaxID=46186 RepID=A0ABN3WFK8_9ACTN
MTVSTAPDARGDLFDPACPTRQILDRLSGKWSSMVIKILAEEPAGEVRFADLRRRVPGMSAKMAAQTLKELERDGVVLRRVEALTPPRVHYSLTPLGVSLDAALAHLREWAELHAHAVDRARTAYDRSHDNGGTNP